MNFTIVLSVFNGWPKTHLLSSMQHLNHSFKGLITPGSLSKMQSEKDSQAAPGGAIKSAPWSQTYPHQFACFRLRTSQPCSRPGSGF